MTVEPGDVLIFKQPLEIYIVGATNEAYVQIRASQDPGEWYVPASFLNNLDPTRYIRISPNGDVSIDFPELRQLGWDPTTGEYPVPWAIKYIQRLEALLKETK